VTQQMAWLAPGRAEDGALLIADDAGDAL
jgi:hypothetical protein